MATKFDEQRAETMKEVIRLLHLAIDECQKALDDAQEGVRKSEQDNQPE